MVSQGSPPFSQLSSVNLSKPVSLHQVRFQPYSIPTGAENLTEAPHQIRLSSTPIINLHWPLSMLRSMHDTRRANILHPKCYQLKYENGADFFVLILMSVIEEIPKYLMIVELFGRQLPTCPLVPLMYV